MITSNKDEDLKKNHVYNCNCLELMALIPEKSVNLIIADPPYFEVKGDFDFIWSSFEDYLKDVEKWAIACKRVLADNGTLFWYGHAKKIAYSQVVLDKYFNLINNLVWNKGSFMGLEESEGLRSFAPCTERILMYGSKKETYQTELGLINNDYNNYFQIREWVKNEREKIPHSLIYLNKHIYGYDNGKDGVAGNKLSSFKQNWQFFDEKNYLIIQNWCKENNYNAFQKPYEALRTEYEALRTEYEALRTEYEALRTEYEYLRRPYNNILNLQEILNFSNEATKTGAKYDHDTIKPEKLTRALILTCSRPTDIVLIPFAGSGTECAMSAREKRDFYACDISEKHCKTANERVSKELSQPTLF